VTTAAHRGNCSRWLRLQKLDQKWAVVDTVDDDDDDNDGWMHCSKSENENIKQINFCVRVCSKFSVCTRNTSLFIGRCPQQFRLRVESLCHDVRSGGEQCFGRSCTKVQ
jgi:hypothetical protein